MPAKLLSLLLALLLALCSSSAQAAGHTASGLFSISYDEAALTLDNVSYHDGSDEYSRWLFVLYGEDWLVDVTIDKTDAYSGLTLAADNPLAMEFYISSMAEWGCEHVETIQANGVSFGVFRMEDEDGPYLLAETVAGGHAIDFYAYYDDPSHAVDEALLTGLRKIVQTYTPETGA